MFNKIAVATDGSPAAMRAVQAAADLATRYDSEVTILHVLLHGEPPESLKRLAKIEHIVDDDTKAQIAFGDVPWQTMTAAVEAHEDSLNEQVIVSMGDRLVEQAKQKCRERGVDKIGSEVLSGAYAEQIVAGAKRNGADLIVLGARGLGPVESLIMGSVSQKVTRVANETCMIVK